jgi:hypothetical protein
MSYISLEYQLLPRKFRSAATMKKTPSLRGCNQDYMKHLVTICDFDAHRRAALYLYYSVG